MTLTLSLASRICFRGFDPSEVLKTQAEATVRELLELAPMESTCLTLVEKEEGGYRARMDIYCSPHNAGPFLVDAIAEEAAVALQKLAVEMRSCLRRWSLIRTLGRRHRPGVRPEPFPAA